MIEIDPAWAGKVQFYELVFGLWTAYIFLVLLWEKVLKVPLPEWRVAPRSWQPSVRLRISRRYSET